MKFRFIWIGKTKNTQWRELQNEYFARVSRFVRAELVELRESRPTGIVHVEGESILAKIENKDLVVVLDIGGRPFSSHELANELSNWQNRSIPVVSFVIGGVNGLSAEVAQRADLRLSLSFLTFTHEMTRVILLEQLYRAYSILNGFPYQK